MGIVQAVGVIAAVQDLIEGLISCAIAQAYLSLASVLDKFFISQLYCNPLLHPDSVSMRSSLNDFQVSS